jgi:hypothetical protein
MDGKKIGRGFLELILAGAVLEFSGLLQHDESPAIFSLLIPVFHQDLCFSPALPTEFPGSKSNQFSEF